MYKNLVFILAVLFATTSCNYFRKEQPIDFTKLDRYPVFYGCDSTANPIVIKLCFEQSVASYLQKDLDTCHYMNLSALKDTGLIVHIEVSNEGVCSLIEIEKINSVEEALPGLESQILESIKNFPGITPAKKMGVPVTSRFMVPLYIQKRTQESI